MTTFCIHEVLSDVVAMFGGASGSNGALPHDTKTLTILAILLLLLTLPLDLTQLMFTLVGAAAYALLQAATLATPHPVGKGAKHVSSKADMMHCPPTTKGALPEPPRAPCRVAALAPAVSPSPQRRSRRPSGFGGWDTDVHKLLESISPTAECEAVVQRTARLVKQALSRLAPDAEVSGHCSADPVRGAAFGVAVPEVDIVVHVGVQTLARMQGRAATRGGETSTSIPDLKKLQKSAIRACTDRLVTRCGFKFRRSAFRGQEPKVTLLVPSSVGLFPEAFPIDFSVNATMPLYNSIILKECNQMEPRAKELALLVKRWAKDRGICHAAKGHLSPYAWNVLVVYFLQVGDEEHGPMLPAMEGCPAAPPSAAGRSQLWGEIARRWAARPNSVQKSPGRLFQDFVKFYCETFDWSREAVNVRSGKRGPPEAGLPIHMVVAEDGSSQVGPSIEDPFKPARNLGDCTTTLSLQRMREELEQAMRLCSEPEPSLAKLLEPWVPADRAGRGGCDDDEDDSPCFAVARDETPRAILETPRRTLPPWRQRQPVESATSF